MGVLDAYKSCVSASLSRVRLVNPSRYHAIQATSVMAHRPRPYTRARDIIAQIKGLSLVLPNLWQYMPASNWPVELHPDIPRLRRNVEERFEWYILTEEQQFSTDTDRMDGMIHHTPSKRHGLCEIGAQDLGLFGAAWWPYADDERMETCTDLCTWVRANPTV